MRIRIGVDLGALYCKVFVIDEQDNPVYQSYEPHLGNPIKTLQATFHELPGSIFENHGEIHLCATGTNAKLLDDHLHMDTVDVVEALIKTVKIFYPEVRSIIDIGGGSVTLIQFNEQGVFAKYTNNSLCAAGTGSFLDEQADRLGISYAHLENFPHHAHPPSIASRCSVFAKSDLIHRQQEGYSKEVLWSGLCKSMTDTLLNTLLQGRPLEGLTVVTGGVSQNHEVIKWLNARYQDQIITFSTAHLAGAYGAALLANGKFAYKETMEKILEERAKPVIKKQNIRTPLVLQKTQYPDFSHFRTWSDDYKNELRVTQWDKNAIYQGFIGIDIGSTSTKMVLIHEDGKVLLDIYRKTAGDPIQAVKQLFSGLITFLNQEDSQFIPLGVGTTGSGRKMIGKIIGADLIINEISAHVKGAMTVDPTIDTIFEIGGQDSKYMRTKHGFIFDTNMNYVCAAGTGSFVEELARKLGFNIKEVGDIILGKVPPPTSDRCTVFMEQDVLKLIREGYSKDEAMAGVIYSVILNYKNKVVGNRYVSNEKIFFQGATALNKGLVAAIETILDVEVVVSPYCHVMGSYGTALLAREKYLEDKFPSAFRGFDLSAREIKIRDDKCALCDNTCTITYADLEGETESPSWGYMCGREPDEKRARSRSFFKPFRIRERLWNTIGNVESQVHEHPTKTIGLPRALTIHSYLPMWKRFFGELGYNIKLSEKTKHETIKSGTNLVGADFCFPIKILHGAAFNLAKDETIDFIFLPNMIGNKKKEHAVDNKFCPYVESAANVIQSSFALNDLPQEKIIKPNIDLKVKESMQGDWLFEELKQFLPVKKDRVKQAWSLALKTFEEYDRTLHVEGEKIVKDLEANKQIGLVIIGRPYNTYDLGSNIGLPEKISDLGYTVIPIDMIPFDESQYNSDYYQMYWNYGQKILSALQYIKDKPNLYPIYFSNYSCGPDSFILSYAEKVMGDKPMLILELDEHGADTGYMTRIEAFLDVVHHYQHEKQNTQIYFPPASAEDFKKRKIWIPPMHPITVRLFAAAFRAWNYDCEALPGEGREAFELGKKYLRGVECLPTTITIGGFLKKLNDLKADGKDHAFFMPTAEGPCRFGQYSTLHRMILNKAGYSEALIMSPSSRNAYQGLEDPLRRRLWDAILIADIIYKIGCKLRPYEKEKGIVNQYVENAIVRMEQAIEENDRKHLNQTFKSIIDDFQHIELLDIKKPLVGVVGEIYIRCNNFANEKVIQTIEDSGGEAWLVPISEWILYSNYLQEWLDGKVFFNPYNLAIAKIKNFYFIHSENHWYDMAEPIIHDRHEPPIKRVIEMGERYLSQNFEGEALLTIGRAILFKEQKARLAVNAAPFGCMPGTITTAIFQQVEQDINLPIVNMFYDGEGDVNQTLTTYLRLIKG